jgi:hypothetical protein
MVRSGTYISGGGKVILTPIYKIIEQNKNQDLIKLQQNCFACCTGRMYGAWVDFDSRDNGYDEGDLIENPVHIIESILRDEIFLERDLSITTVTDNAHFIVTGLLSAVNDYYNDAYIHNVTRNESDLIVDYTGASKTVHTNNGHVDWEEDDLLYIDNIQGTQKIDITNFDFTAGLRSGMYFNLGIYDQESTQTIIETLLHEAFLLLVKQDEVYKIIAIEETIESIDTWTNPLKQSGAEMITVSFTPLESLFYDYRLKFDHVQGKEEYLRELFVNKNGYSANGLSDGATLQGLCEDVETNYKAKNKWEYKARCISTNTLLRATARTFFSKTVNWHTKQRLIVEWSGDFGNYAKYELGDIVKLNYSKYIPNALNNSAQFMIFEKNFAMRNGDPYITFLLMQL